MLTTMTKKATTLTANPHLLATAKMLKINLSATFEAALEKEVQARQAALWRLENRSAIDAYNEQIEQDGLFADHVRSF
ncbi:MAG: type II toxin-antitoxin system CcdA family antitoxin [Undibacterium sp.]|uniref:type II toxin-antitoxin system CcdA family antitoxin n=1 Tax=Undibacterium sp. TaxID=1914977 RepID=UPI0027286E05|nr:type II toxin-antitoxin system CcdA family antitoxin [Undibacterium sp.]MDO8654530.1 type II toxin-antitoxin system CcdA family antitoxin [Undibacterium sp.]